VVGLDRLGLRRCLSPGAMGEATDGPGLTATDGPGLTATGGRGATATGGRGAPATAEIGATATDGPAAMVTSRSGATATAYPAATAATTPVRDGEETTPTDSGPRLRLDWQEAPMHAECLPPPKARVPAAVAAHGLF
jgi:hypothetical protein